MQYDLCFDDVLNTYKSFYPDLEYSDKKILKYSNAESEIEAINHSVGIRDISLNTLLSMQGNDSIDFLHRISTNTFSKFNENEKRTTLFTNEKGRFIDKTTVFAFKSNLLLLGSRRNEGFLKYWLEKYIIAEDITVENKSGSYAIFQLYGPQVESFLTLICGKAIDLLDEKRFLHLNVEKMNLVIAKMISVKGVKKYIVMTEIENHASLVKTFISQNGIFSPHMIGEDVFDLYKIEHEMAEGSTELNDNFNPHEAKLAEFIDFTKGCYIGQEVIARLDSYDKVQKFLTKLKLDAVPEELPVSLVDNEGNDAGVVTTVSKIKDEFGNFPAIGYIRKKYIELGTPLYSEEESDIKFRVSGKLQK